MGTSFVRIGDHGFWMLDSILQFWLRLLALHVQDPEGNREIAQAIRERWFIASSEPFTGCVPHGLNELVASPQGRQVVIAAIESLLTALKHGPPMISANVANLIGLPGSPFPGREFERERLLEIGDAFLDLIDGKITAKDKDRFPGSR